MKTVFSRGSSRAVMEYVALYGEDSMDFVWNESPCRGAPLHQAVLRDQLWKIKELVGEAKSPLEAVRTPFAFTDHESHQEGRAEAVHIAASRGNGFSFSSPSSLQIEFFMKFLMKFFCMERS